MISVHDKNQLVPTKASTGIARGAGASNEITI